MTLSELSAAKAVAKTNFKFKNPEFVEIFNVSEKIVEKDGILDEIDLWAVIAVSYDGEPPDNYRVLNSMVMDYTEDNFDKLGKIIADPLKTFFVERFPEVDLSELMEKEDNVADFIWEEQVDFSPEIDEENKKILFNLELVIEIHDLKAFEEETEESEK